MPAFQHRHLLLDFFWVPTFSHFNWSVRGDITPMHAQEHGDSSIHAQCRNVGWAAHEQVSVHSTANYEQAGRLLIAGGTLHISSVTGRLPAHRFLIVDFGSKESAGGSVYMLAILLQIMQWIRAGKKHTEWKKISCLQCLLRLVHTIRKSEGNFRPPIWRFSDL